MSRFLIFIYFLLSLSVSAFGLESQKSNNQIKSFSDLEELSRIEASITGQMGLLLLDSSTNTERMFASIDFKKWIVIKPEIVIIDKPPGTVLAGSKISKYFYLSGSKNYFFVVSGFDESRIKSHIKTISNALKPHVKSAKNLNLPLQILSVLVTRAEAKEGTCLSSISSVNSKPVTSDDFKYIKGVWGCIKGAGIGIWDSTGGVITSAVSFAAGAIESGYCAGHLMLTHTSTPSCGEIADGIENSVNSVFRLISSSQEVLNELIDGFKDLPGPLQAKLGCEVVASMVTTGAVVYYTAGAGAPIAVARVLQILEKLKKTSEYANNSKKIDALIESLKQKKTRQEVSKTLPADIQFKKDQIQWAHSRYDIAYREQYQAQLALDAIRRPKYLSSARVRKNLDHSLSFFKKRSAAGHDPKEISRAATEILDHAELTGDQIKILEKLKQSSKNLGSYQIVEDGYPYQGINQIQKTTYNRKRKEVDKLSEQAAETFSSEGVPLIKGLKYADEAEWIAYEKELAKNTQALKQASAEVRFKEKDLKSTVAEYNRLVDKKIVDAGEKKALIMKAKIYSVASGCETASAVRDSTNQQNAKPANSVR